MIFKINKLTIQNFLSLGNVGLEFSDSGIILVQGIVQDSSSSDSNGSGKSSMIDAINWCLFDETLRGVGKDDIVNEKIGRDCFVKLEGNIEGNKVEVIRYRKHQYFKNQIKLFYNNNDISESTDSKTNEAIERLLKMSFEDFQTNIVFSNNSMKFLELGDTDRKKLFDSIIKSDLYERCIDKVKIQVKDLSKEVDKKNIEKSAIQGNLDNLKITEGALQKQSTLFEEDKMKKISAFENLISTLRIEYSKEIDGFRTIEEIDTKIILLEEEAKKIQQEIDETFIQQNKLGEEKSKILEKLNENKSNLLKSENIENLNKELNEKRKQFEDLRVKSSEAKSNVSSITHEHEIIMIQMLKNETEVKNNQKSLDENMCPLCKQKLEDNKLIIDKIIELKNTIIQQESAIKEKTKLLFSKNEGLNEVVKEGELKKHEILIIENNIEKEKKISEIEVQLIEKEIEAKTLDIKSRQDEIFSKRSELILEFTSDEKINRLKEIKTEKLSSKEKLENTEKELKYSQESKNIYVELIKDTDIKIQDKNIEMKNCENELEKINKNIEDHKYWVRGFKKIKGLLISTITPIMNEKAQEYSRVLTDNEFEIKFITQKENKDGTIREVFNIEVNRKNGGCKYNALSSGEKRRVDLITIFVLDELKRMNCTHDINVRFYDEIFDSLDEIGIEKIIGLLNIIAVNKEIYVISHRSDMKDLFSKSITFIKTNGISRILL